MVQLKLEFQLENTSLPRELDRALVSFLKASLQNYSQDLFESLYDKSRSIIKPYTYSCYLPGACFRETTIELNQNRFVMFFSDADLGELIHFFNAFKAMIGKRYPMKENYMTLVRVFTQERKEITESEIVVKMQSSLIVRKHDSENNTDIYYTYDQPGFAETLKENVSIYIQKLGIPLQMENFSVIPIKGKKIVAGVFGRKVDANLGIYKLTGSPELLNHLYFAGMGVRRSSGHGKFELIW